MITFILIMAIVVMAPFAWVDWRVIRVAWPFIRDREARRALYGMLHTILDRMDRATPAEQARAMDMWLERAARDLDEPRTYPGTRRQSRT